MSLISQPIPALFNGVSQQPATLRLASQAEAQVNGMSNIADGLRKRPPTEHVGFLSASDLSSAFIHDINRDVNERYIVVIDGTGSIAVYDKDGVAQTVNFPLNANYVTLAGGTAKSSFAAVTIADYTFIINKSVTVAMDPASTALPTGFSDYYEPSNWREREDTTYYNAGTYVYRGVKQTFADLPPTEDNPIEGDVWKIAGYDEDGFGAYFVKRTGGVWEETYGPSTINKFNDQTMPWALVRESDGEFYFRPFKWTVRNFGDDTSNPPPTFVGRTLNDVFFYKNRLAFVSDENVIFSGAGDFGNFWRNTVTQLLDSDVVDVAVSTNNVALLKYAVPFNNNLMLFADQTQFSLNVDQLLTPSSVSIDAVTNFEMNVNARPVAIGNEVYFATNSGNYSRIREYFVQEGDGNSTDAADITAHVPRYLPKSITKLTGNANEDILFALSADHPNRIYVYKFFWNEDGKAQSSWSYWEHGDTTVSILNIEVLENELYIVAAYADGTVLEKCNVQVGTTTGTLDHEVLLDRQVTLTGVYSGGSDWTTFTLPYDVATALRGEVRAVQGGNGATPGALLDTSQYVWDGPNEFHLAGDHSGQDVHVGLSYEFRYTFSEQFLKRNQVAVTTGRLQLRTFVIYFTDAAYFKTEVSPYGVSPVVEEIVTKGLSEFTGKTLGDNELILNSPVFETGQYAFQVYGNSRDAVVSLVNDSHVQTKLQSAEFEAFYFNRAR